MLGNSIKYKILLDKECELDLMEVLFVDSNGKFSFKKYFNHRLTKDFGDLIVRKIC